jgi:hypothetical protein
MKILEPTPEQAATLVQAMHAVATANGTLAADPLESASIESIQRHMMRLASPLAPRDSTLPADLEAVLDTPVLRKQAVRFMAILAVLDRKVLPAKVAVVLEAARRLGVDEFGLLLLGLASQGRWRRITFKLAGRFVAWSSPSGKAGVRDWVKFMWWMLPVLHGEKTRRANRELTARYRALAGLPPGTFGHTLMDFYRTYDIAIPGEPKSLPWAMHEVFHVLSEYGVSLPSELWLTAFMGGSQEDMCLDQMLFGLFSYHLGRPIVGGVVSEGLFAPEDYFRAMARGASIKVDLVHGWDLFAVAEVPMAELRGRYGIPPVSPYERERTRPHDGLLRGAGHSTPALEPALA